jgi:serine/threonine protein kinase
MRLLWIQQLLSALEWLEKLGYTHGDLQLQNMGIDNDLQLRLFDFGSVRYCEEADYSEQVLEDHFSLATCIHALASGVNVLAEAKSRIQVQETLKKTQ